MKMIGSSTQVNFFINTTLLQADSKAILKLVPFIEDGFVPSFGEELSGNGVKNKIFRIEKEVDDFNYVITFGTQVVSFQFDTPVNQASVELFNIVKIQVEKLIATFNGELPPINRVSVVINQGYEFNSELEFKLHNDFFKVQEIPYEWNFRRAMTAEFESTPIYEIVSVTKGSAIINIRGNTSEKETILLTIDNNINIDRTTKTFRFDDLSFVESLFTKSISDFYRLLEG